MREANLCQLGIVEYIQRDMANGQSFIDLRVDGEAYATVGPFDTAGERDRALEDLLQMARTLGARDLPNRPQ